MIVLSILKHRVVEDLIKGKFEGIIEHPRNHSLEHRGAVVDGRVSVDLDEPSFELAVDHEVVTEYLEALLPSIDINFPPGCDHRNPNNLPYFGLQLVIIVFRHVSLHLRQVHLIA